jgi:hypothetical protein
MSIGLCKVHVAVHIKVEETTAVGYLQLKRRVRIVYRGLGRAFVVNKNRDLEENNFFVAFGLVC